VKGACNCFGCRKHGNVIELVRLLEGIETAYAAGLKMQEMFGIESTRLPKQGREAPPQERAPAVTGPTAPEFEPVNLPLPFTFKHLDPTRI
jgi:DNA primase